MLSFKSMSVKIESKRIYVNLTMLAVYFDIIILSAKL